MKNTKKAFKKSCKKHLDQFNYKEFKKNNPKLLKSILDIIKENGKEKSDFTKSQKIIENFRDILKITTIDSIYVISQASFNLKKN